MKHALGKLPPFVLKPHAVVFVVRVVDSVVETSHGTRLGELVGPIATIRDAIAHFRLEHAASIVAAETRAVDDAIQLGALVYADAVGGITVDDLTLRPALGHITTRLVRLELNLLIC